MRIARGSFKHLLAIVLCVATPLQAKVLTARIASIDSGAGSMRDVRVTLDWPDGAVSGRMHIRAGRLDFPSIAYHAKDVDWQCPLLRPGEGRWRCAGEVGVRGSRKQRLALNLTAGSVAAVLGVGRSSIAFGNAASAPGISHVQLQRVPVTWLKPFLAGLWPTGRWTAGSMDGSIDVMTPNAGPSGVRTDLDLVGVTLETPDGLLAAEGLKGRLQLDYRNQGQASSVDSTVTLRAGELLYQSLYAKLPASPVTVRVQARRVGAAPWQLPAIEWRDPGVLVASGKASLDAGSSIRDLDLALTVADLAIARDRYLSGFLAPAGFNDVLLTGKLEAGIQMRGGAFSRLTTSLHGINAVDPKARFTFAGIDGRLGWTLDRAPISGEVRWNSGALFGIGLGPARFPLTSSAGSVKLDSAARVDSLQGSLVLDHLRWQAPAGDRGPRVEFGLSMDSMDLGSLSQRLGWPAFTGTISGKIPSARLEKDVLTMDGGLQVSVFGGSINVQKLSMERPFGVAPSLSADVAIQDIDLEPMTRVFGFGSITGRLDGRIAALRLVDWSAEAFDAWLETDQDWKGKRRISQRAVKDITSVGGGGISGGLQAQALKIFDDFGYQRIGIGCKLKDRVCTMDGIGSAGEGYIIVAGAGLPRIQVVGFRRKVDWPTLVSRLQAATDGQAPIIQ